MTLPSDDPEEQMLTDILGSDEVLSCPNCFQQGCEGECCVIWVEHEWDEVEEDLDDDDFVPCDECDDDTCPGGMCAGCCDPDEEE